MMKNNINGFHILSFTCSPAADTETSGFQIRSTFGSHHLAERDLGNEN